MSDVTVFGSHGEGTLAQLATCAADERVAGAALMADGHLGYSMPIGGVIAYQDAVSPSGVGFDIACGNMAVRTDIQVADAVGGEVGRLLQGAAGETPPDPLHGAAATDTSQGREITPEGELKNEAPTRAYSALPSESIGRILREIQTRVAFGIGRKNEVRVNHELFEDPLWTEVEALSPGLKEKAEAQLGTVGSGNHYVDLLVDENGWLWVANHFGSRGFGHTIASGFLSISAGKQFGERVPETDEPSVLDLGTPSGDLYLSLMRLAGRYAYAGREAVMGQVLEILDSPRVTLNVHNHHNYAWEEDGLIVVRKGATPLTDEPAFIGASMGEPSVIVKGTGEDLGNLASAPHGAGRAMSRTKAAGKMRKFTEERERPDGSTYTFKGRRRDESTAAINWREVQRKLHARGITVLGAGADEAPGAYKRLDEVLVSHPNVEVLHRLDPIGVVMAGDDTFDPYKD